MASMEVVKSESVELKREEDSDPDPSNPVTKAIEKFRESLDTAFPLQRLRDFYDEESIKTIAALERGKALDNFFSTVAKSVEGEQVCRMFTELENGIQRTKEDFIKLNQHFRTEAEKFLEEILCREYEKSVGLQLYLEPLMELEKFVEVLNVEKNSAFDCFLNVWPSETVKQEQIKSVTEKLTHIQNELLEKHKNLMESQSSLATALANTDAEQSETEAEENDDDEDEDEIEIESAAVIMPTRTRRSPSSGPGPSSESESSEKDSNFKKLEQQILEILKEVQIFIVPTLHFLSSPERVQTKEKWFAQNILKEIRVLLDNHGNASGECRRAHKKLLRVVQAADDILKLTFPQHSDIPDEDFNAWMEAFKIDVEECLPSQQEFKDTRRVKRVIWVTNLICGKMRKYENSHGGWIVEGRERIRDLLMEEMQGIEKEAEKKKLRAGLKRKSGDCNVKGDGYPEPEFLMERLRRIWSTRKTTKTDSSRSKRALKRQEEKY